LKSLESANAEKPADQNEAPITHRSLLWHKDTKSGRTLEITPMFTDGAFVYCVAFQKQQLADRNIPMLVVEVYDAKQDFVFVR
jgi:hypothetical protein